MYKIIVNLKIAIEQEIYKTPGMHPVEFGMDEMDLSAINLGFDYKIGDEVFRVKDSFRPNQGLYVVKSEVDAPTLETGFKGVLKHVIHLPEGWTLPVGPVYFGEKEPPTTAEVIAYIEKKKKERFLGLGKVKGISPREIEHYISKEVWRYFNWQPQLPETPKFIWWDVSRSDAESLGRTPDDAPLITKTRTWNEWNPTF